MDGGVLSVPFDRLDDFYKKYVEAVNTGEQIFVVEQKTEIFNFFVDLDYKSDASLSFVRIEYLTKLICDKVTLLGGKNCLISVAKPKKVADDKIKTGVHMNWENFPVNQRAAVSLRGHILRLLKIGDDEDWDNIVDSSVYGNPETGTKGSGFRLPWSHKKGKHVDCNGKGCTGCDKTGKLTEVEYLPLFQYISGNPFSILNKISFLDPTVELLKAATIRTTETVSVKIVEPENTISTIKKSEGKFTRAQTKCEISNQEISILLETFIRQYLEGQKNVRINKIFKHDSIYLVGTNSSYCENIKRSHNSNHIWFLVSETCIQQKCFCKCETLQGRRDGFCKDFSGRRHIMNPTLVNLLFPNKKCDKIKSAIRSNVLIVHNPTNCSSSILLSKS